MRPEPNLPLLRKGLEWVEEQAARPAAESEWYQPTWRVSGAQMEQPRQCGTAYCLGGYICEITGGQWKELDTNSGALSADLVAEPEDIEFFRDSWCKCSECQASSPPETISAERRAQRLLGLSGAQARDLFASGNNARMIRYLMSRIFQDAGEKL